jgi:hypothetical protein
VVGCGGEPLTKQTGGIMKEVMIDLETWGNTAYAVVIQIGAVEFDRVTGETGKELMLHVNADSELRRGFKCDASTLYWWFEQSKKAQEMACGGVYERTDNLVAFRALNTFLKNKEAIWCHGSFDAAIVNTHMNVLGIPPAYPYWVWKDLRTLVEILKLDTRVYKKNASGTLHDAIDDCKMQIKYTVDALNKLEVK